MVSCLRLDGVSGYVTCPDIPAISAADKIRVLMDVEPDSWTPTGSLVTKGEVNDSNAQFAFIITGGNVLVGASMDGSAIKTNFLSVGPVVTGRHVIDITADRLSSPQLTLTLDGVLSGTTGNLAGWSSPLATVSSNINIGHDSSLSNTYFKGKIYRILIFADDVLVANPDFTHLNDGQSTFVDDAGNTWTLQGSASVEETSSSHLRLDGTANTYASCPDIAALAGAMTLDIEMEVALDDWTEVSTNGLMSQGEGSGTRAFRFGSSTSGDTGTLYFDAPFDGTASQPAFYADPAGFEAGSKHWVAARFEADIGTGISRLTYQKSADGTSWVNIYPPITHGTELPSGLFDSSTPIRIGSNYGVNLNVGNFYSCRIYADGILVASPDFNTLAPGTTSFTDNQGNLWTLTGNAQILEGDGLPTWNPGFDDDDYFFFFSDLV